MKIISPMNQVINLDWYLSPSMEASVLVPRLLVILRMGSPRTIKETNMPSIILKNDSHISVNPKTPAAPPNPTMAEVLMNVEA